MSSPPRSTYWDPGQYLRYADQRARPAHELAARIDCEAPCLVCDLGCGPGTMAREFTLRWPAARILGVDHSSEMLERAASEPSRVEWIRADLATWEPPAPADVLFSNAALHWLPDHESLLPRLVNALAHGGVLAVQMPLSFGEPSHRLVREILANGGPGTAPIGPPALREQLARPAVLAAERLFDCLAPHVSRLDVWETRYHHVLEGEDPVLDWVRGTSLRPVLETLDADESARFLDAYRSALRRAYPPRADGRTLFPFPRLFFVAVR